jgi:hypothetical protein
MAAKKRRTHRKNSDSFLRFLRLLAAILQLLRDLRELRVKSLRLESQLSAPLNSTSMRPQAFSD